MSESKDLKEVIRQIQSWHSEAVNFRNDGWVQQEYKDRLETLHARVTAVMETLRPHDEPAEVKEPEEKSS
jgi:hypothetical protein|tara:strand:+ start:228 stop:437 length:210 start_codon:yes stop_codon:yes gene_type:complete